MHSLTKKTYAVFWQATRRYWVAVFLAMAALTWSGIAHAIIPYYFKRFFDVLARGMSPEAVTALFSILIVIITLELVQWAGWRVSNFTASYFQSRVIYDLHLRCFRTLHRHSLNFFNNSFVGALVKKVKWFARAYETISDEVLWHIYPLVVNVVTMVVILAFRSWWLAGGIVVWLAVFLVINAFLIRYKLRFDLARNEAETAVTGLLADTITNHSTVRLYNGLAREFITFGSVSRLLQRLRQKTWNFGNVFEGTQALLMIGLEFAMLYGVLLLWQDGRATIGDFVLVQTYVILLFNRLWDLGRMIRHIYESLADANEMMEIMELPHEITDPPQAVPLNVRQGGIDFEAVAFSYPRTKPVLNNFSLSIAAREHVALVGSSGAGKSTIVKLLLREHDVALGRICVDGQDISRITQESLRQAISVVPQDPLLFHRSIAENIRYGRPDATDAEVVAAASVAHCHEFIHRLPDRYATLVGERGVKLSAGERQRVAIARAVLRNAPILIFDEATSSLDSQSEQLIQDALATLMRGRTVLAIAHRLSTIRKMDRIVVVGEGGIVEQGTHSTLVKQVGVYHTLWQLQSGGFIS